MELAVHRWNGYTATRGESKSIDPPKFVFLHGLGGTGKLWRPIAANLESDFDILAPDQRGHGGSRGLDVESSSFSPENYGEDIVATMEKLHFHPAILVGHSMGVRSACAASHLRPEFVSGLVLVDLGLSGEAGGGIGTTLREFLSALPSRFDDRKTAREKIEAACPDPSIAQYLMAVLTQDASGRVLFPFDHEALMKTIDEAMNSNSRIWTREAAENGIPILVLRGANSRVFSRDEFLKEKEEFKDLKNVHFEEVEGAGHGLPFEKRAEFVARLKRFSLKEPRIK